MFNELLNIAFDPLLSVGWIIVLGFFMFLAALAAGIGRFF